MTTIKELKKFLEQFPEDTEVRILKGCRGGCYDGDYYRWENLNLEKDTGTWEYTDFHGNQFVKSTHSFYNKKILNLGDGE